MWMGGEGAWSWLGCQCDDPAKPKMRYPEGIQIFRKEFLVSDQDLRFILRLKQRMYEV